MRTLTTCGGYLKITIDAECSIKHILYTNGILPLMDDNDNLTVMMMMFVQYVHDTRRGINGFIKVHKHDHMKNTHM